MKYIYLGYEKREYVNRHSEKVVGYNIFYAYNDNGFTGFKPSMRFDATRKSLGYPYLNEGQFERLGLSSISPLSTVDITFNQFGGIESLRVIK